MNKQEQHLAQDDLILFLDRELAADATAVAEQHLMTCSGCAQRLLTLKQGSEAYAQYRETVLMPVLHVPATGWARLSQQAGKEKRRRLGWVWAAACACGLALAFVYWQISEQPSAQEVLSQAEAAATVPATTSLLLTTGNERLFRPAVLESGHSEARFQHVRALFVQANYSWENPLSARSFSAWRRSLTLKDDTVTSLREQGGRKFYRVQTRTANGILRSASLTLQAESYHPTKVEFSFEGEDLMELREQAEPPRNGLEVVQTIPPTPPKIAETPATPEDELRVFAALDALGAVAEEPIDVKMDTDRHAVLVTGIGLPPSRRKEIEIAMATLPRTVARFSAGAPLPDVNSDSVNQPNSAAADESLAFRQNLQDRYGGAHQLQTATDRAMDASNGLFARSHLLLLLAREFPPAIESALSAGSATNLLGLRQRHVGAMEYALRQLKQEISPLLSDTSSSDAGKTIPKSANWQNAADALFTNARNLDRTVSRLLSGRYTEQEGNTMMKQVPSDLLKVEILIHAQSTTDH